MPRYLKVLRKRHREAIRWLSKGIAPKDVAEKLHVHLCSVYNWVNDPIFASALEDAKKRHNQVVQHHRVQVRGRSAQEVAQQALPWMVAQLVTEFKNTRLVPVKLQIVRELSKIAFPEGGAKVTFALPTEAFRRALEGARERAGQAQQVLDGEAAVPDGDGETGDPETPEEGGE